MAKKDLFVNGRKEQISDVTAMFRKERETYAMNLYQLQSKAGLTFKEARAFLSQWYETVAAMAMDIGVGIHAIYNMQRRAKRKIADSKLSLEDIFGDYPPIDVASNTFF